MSTGSPVPDRRRRYFPLNGGPRPTEADDERARRGLAKARKALADIKPHGPSAPTVVERLTPEQSLRARRGIEQARAALHRELPANQENPDPSSERHAA